MLGTRSSGARICSATSTDWRASRRLGRGRPARREVAEKRLVLGVEAAQLERRARPRAPRRPRTSREQRPRSKCCRRPGESNGAPHRHLQEEGVADGVDGRPLHHHARDRAEGQMRRGPRGHHRVHEDVGDAGAEVGPLLIAEAHLGVVAAAPDSAPRRCRGWRSPRSRGRAGRRASSRSGGAGRRRLTGRLEPPAELPHEGHEAPVEGRPGAAPAPSAARSAAAIRQVALRPRCARAASRAEAGSLRASTTRPSSAVSVFGHHQDDGVGRSRPRASRRRRRRPCAKPKRSA